MGRPVMRIVLDDEVRGELIRRERGSTTPKRDSIRAAIVLRKQTVCDKRILLRSFKRAGLRFPSGRGGL